MYFNLCAHDNNEKVIIVFSKDRPDRLSKVLPFIPSKIYKVYLLDDSCSLENRTAIQELCTQYGLTYHGVNEQKAFVEGVVPSDSHGFFKELGNREWALGYIRNYALFYSLYVGARKVLFMDDDILANPTIFNEYFDALDEVSFVGTKITLMPDDSIVGHIYRAGGELLPQYVSGSFLGVNLLHINHYFINIYNEDWIWLYLENNGRSVQTVDSVKQLHFNPFKDWEEKIHFQEFGEVVLDGIFNSPNNARESRLIDPLYWQEVLLIRINEIKRISTFQLPRSMSDMVALIQDNLFDYHKNLFPEMFSSLFENYYKSLYRWHSLIRSFHNCN